MMFSVLVIYLRSLRCLSVRLFPYTTLFRSFRIYRFTQQTPYWKASVDFFEDDESHSSMESLYDQVAGLDRKSTRLNSSHLGISYAVICLKKKFAIKRITLENLYYSCLM